jgi:hypothetical protein
MKLAKQLFMSLFLIVVLSNLVGCASGVKFPDYAKDMSSIDQSQSRLFVYRSTAFGAAIQPVVTIDDVATNNAVPMGFFFKDVAPGNHTVKCSTEVKRKLSFTTKPGQTKYVRLDVSMGFFVGHISPKLIDEEIALKELQKCKYIGYKSDEPIK